MSPVLQLQYLFAARNYCFSKYHHHNAWTFRLKFDDRIQIHEIVKDCRCVENPQYYAGSSMAFIRRIIDTLPLVKVK